MARVSSSLNVNDTPEYSRELNSQYYNGEAYQRTSNERVNVDICVTKHFNHNVSTSLNARNILSTDYKERLNKVSDGSLYQARSNETIPSFLFSLEKKF